MISILTLGFPRTGKTTFVAALWHLLTGGDPSKALHLVQLPPETEYLNNIRDKWLEVVEIGRTQLEEGEEIVLDLRDIATNRDFTLKLPDVSGESFDLQWESRTISKEYASSGESAEGILLFIHPDEVEKGDTIARVSAMADHLPEEISKPEASAQAPKPAEVKRTDAEKKPATPWDPKLAPSQVKVVDVLQIVQSLSTPRKRRIVIIISAWDLLQNLALTPPEWIERQQPLLHTYITNNPELYETRVFGVSAQGGKIPAQADELRGENPADRIRVVSAGEPPSKDLAGPLLWLIGGGAR